MDTLGPKEIQARIRAGATPDELAQDTGVPLDRILRFSGPPLAERAWTSEQARAAILRRDDGDSSLDDVVTMAAARDGFDPASVSWDSWRRDDGRWAVVAAYSVDGADRIATWVFDPRVRSLHADDEAALRMSGDDKVVPLHTARSAGRATLIVAREEPVADVEVIEVVDIEVDEQGGLIELAETVEVVDTEPAQPSKGKKGRRASVPSWDEILFGAGRPDA
ncbi:MAG: septation protein SepH [Actinomycetota bacterium]